MHHRLIFLIHMNPKTIRETVNLLYVLFDLVNNSKTKGLYSIEYQQDQGLVKTIRLLTTSNILMQNTALYRT